MIRIDEIEVAGYGSLEVIVECIGETPFYISMQGYAVEENSEISFTVAESKALRKAMKRAERAIKEGVTK